MRMALLVGFLLCLLLTESFTLRASGMVRDAAVSVGQNDAAPSVAVRSLTARRRIRITENRGQIADTDGNLRPDIRFYANAGNAQLYFTQSGISLVFAQHDDGSIGEATGRPVRMDESQSGIDDASTGSRRTTRLCRMDMVFAGANPEVRIVADEILDGVTNYYYAHCPDGVLHVPSHGRLTYRSIYDNIDFVFTTDVGRCKYEFIVHPGGRVEDIRLRYAGARDITYTPDGGLAITSAFGGVLEQAPLTYQESGKKIASTFMLKGDEVGFMVGAYDAAQDLVIDPWATYVGGSADDGFYDTACDNAGTIYVCGQSLSSNYPLFGAFQSVFNGVADAVLTKFSPDGQLLIWSTYYGGSAEEGASALALDSQGAVVIAGSTESTDFPVQNPLQASNGGYWDMFLVKLNSAGMRLWATYLGGSKNDGGGGGGVPIVHINHGAFGLAFDAADNMYLYSRSASTTLPVTPGGRAHSAAFFDTYIAKFSPGVVPPLTLSWATYFGSDGSDYSYDLVLTPQNTVVISGGTTGTNFPLLYPYQSLHYHGPAYYWDGFLAEFSSSGTLLWSTYYGGPGGDYANAIATDAQGALYACFQTGSDNLPTLQAYQPNFAGGSTDLYLCKFGTAPTPGSSRPLVWATYFGGSDGENNTSGALAVSDGGNLVITGLTSSTDFPLKKPMQSAYGGSTDMAIACFTTDGGLDWSTYNGGSGFEIGYSTVFQSSTTGFICGYTSSTDFPVVSPYQAASGGGRDAVLLSFELQQTPPTPPAPPTNLTATAQTPTRIALAWTDNADSETRFVVEHQTASGPWTQYVILSPNTESYLARNLAPLTTHRFRVKAANSQFESAYTNTAEATTAAFSAPTNLQASTVSIDEVHLTWTDNSQNETAFIVECTALGGPWQPRDTVPAGTTAFTVSGLIPFTSYSFRVAAMEDAISSAYSNTATASTLDLLAPTELDAEALSFADVRLRWKDNTPYESYYVIEIQETGGPWTPHDTLQADTGEWIVTGLTAVTDYSFRVKAVRNTYSSTYSNTAQARTKAFLPAPLNLAATVLNPNEVRLNWQDNSSGETGFEVERRLDGEDWLLLLTTAANEVTYTAGGLLPDTTYTFRVRSVGDNAASAWSNEVTVGTFAPPLTPVNLDAAATSYRSVRIAWQRGSANEMQFEVERKTAGESWALVRTAARGVFSADDDGLDASMTYWYRVRAINSLGTSPWSAEDTATTFAVPLPSKPIGLTAAATGASSIRLTWAAPSPQYQAGFEIQESLTLNDADFNRITPDAAANAVTYDRGGLAGNTMYYYRIRSFNASGSSVWSSVASARTLQQDPNLPGDPMNPRAVAVSMSEISLTWDMPSPSKEDGFEIEQSTTGSTDDFTLLSPNPVQGARTYAVSGLQPNTTYWYRLRAFNAYGYSQYSPVVSATTPRVPLSQQLITAMQAKEALYPGLENLIATGDAEMTALRSLFGGYSLGYSEDPARTLIASWQNSYPDDQTRAAEALERYTFFEQAMKSGFNDTQFTPPVEGAWEMSREASGAPAMLTKDACALALAWAAQRSALGTENHYIDAAMEDLLLPVADGTQTMLALMGANDDDAVSSFAEEALHSKGAVGGLTLRMLLSVLNYWQERIAGRHYFPASGPAIQTFADRCEQLDIGDTRQSAIAKRDGFTLAVRDRTNALSLGYTQYAGICTGLDAAYSISQTLAPTVEIFLQRLTQLRPRLVDGIHKAITDADIPVERFLYLTSTADIPGLDPLPSSLLKVGSAIFHPEVPGSPHVAEQGMTERRSVPQQTVSEDMSSTMAINPDPAIESDRTALIVLRERIVAGDAAYAATEFDALRAGGREMTAAIARAERPLFGIAPAEMHRQPVMRGEYYRAIARSTLLRTRRTVLSVSLADYALAPTAPKQAALVAEIDSIIGPLDDVITGLEDLKSGQAGTLITLPALALTDADIVRDESAGPTRYRLRFAVTNTGGALAASPVTELSFLTEGVTALQQPRFTFADIATATSVRDSLDIDIPSTTGAVAISAALRTGGSVFIDRRTLAVPPSTTRAEKVDAFPASCLLHQNHPNPFRPTTTISFSLKQSTVVTVVVTDVLGREVARLCDDERRSAGTHSVTFDARALTSGMYFYRLEAAGIVQTRKMVLMR
ncbi:MAG: fibronectin type III domain-containing protein [Bacteroidota bacterium]